MRLFLDTNILFDYLLDSRGSFHEPAVQLMRRVAMREIEAGFSTSQATDIYYSLRKAVGDKAARDALRGLYELCDLYPTPPQACTYALGSKMGDYEDAVQVETARFAGCAIIVTRDLGDYIDASLPAMGPASVVEAMDRGGIT